MTTGSTTGKEWMNNGKVRIYELSRELNLENKDILGICDQLNIAVKSHSSTITESEAERIRSQAGKYPAHQAPAKRPPERTERKSGSPSPVSTRQNTQNKQQILEIKHQSGSGSNSQPQLGSKVANPPQPPSLQHTASPPMKPTTLNKPVRVPQQGATPPPVDDQSSPSPEGASVEKNPPRTEQSSPPEIAQPPVRPAPPEETRPKVPAQQPTIMVERPVLKRNPKVDQPSVSPKTAQTEAKPITLKKPTPTPEPTVQTRAAEPVQPVPELQRPQRVVKDRPPTVETPVLRGEKPAVVKKGPAVVPATHDDEVLLGSPTLAPALGDRAPIPDLIRPTPPRLPGNKERKNRIEEPEDDLENASKSSKVGRRQPRQLKLDEDEDVFEALDEELPESVMVSLSVARPPKPKGRPGQPVQPAAALAPSATKGKKPRQGGTSETAKDKGRGREQKAVNERPEKVVLTGSMTIRELAAVLAVPETEIIKKLFFKGMAVNITQTLDIATASMVAEELGVEVETADEESDARPREDWIGEEDLEHLRRRPPVVTIMGHVDHGKTSLLDAIREAKVAQGEAGGITQHIGAYHVDVEHAGKQEQIVFLDTPGHQAFTAMRARGARVTDIAVLVVAADDGVQPQTVEAISHAKAAEVQIVVAINKIDKPDAQPDRVKQELTEYNLVPEEWGGDTIMVPVSALQRENLDTLLEMILLVAEVDEELVANPDARAKGTVIEANLDKSRGPVATLLVQNGTLRVGDTLVAGSVFGKVRAMIDDRGKRVESAGPSRPVEVLGLSNVPAAGDEFEVFENEKEARALAQERSSEQRQSRLQQVMASRRVTLNSLSAQAQEGELKELNLILKADVQGSVEAILGSLQQLPQNEVQIRVLLAAPGEITETDVDLAAASGAVIVGFNTTLASGARAAADEAAVDVREYNIIYNLLDDIQGAMEGLLEPEQVEEALGQVEVRAVFPVGRGSVAGCYVLSGKAIRNCKVRVRRNGKVIYEGSVDSLKRMKDDVKEVNAGYECGIGIDKFNDWAEGDIIETYQMVSKRRTLSQS